MKTKISLNYRDMYDHLCQILKNNIYRFCLRLQICKGMVHISVEWYNYDYEGYHRVIYLPSLFEVIIKNEYLPLDWAIEFPNKSTKQSNCNIIFAGQAVNTHTKKSAVGNLV